MRLALTIALLTLPALAAAEQEQQPAPPPRISSSGGVVTIRGTTSQTPRPAQEPEKPASEAEPADAEAPKAPRRVRSSAYEIDPGGRRRSVGSQVVERSNGVSGAETVPGPGGRRLPYLQTRTKTISSSGGKEVSERRVQLYDPSGKPSGQEMIRIEERQLPGGGVERSETLYRQNVSGRMEAVERTREVTHEKGSVTTVMKEVEKPDVSGRFEKLTREETTERKLSDSQSTRETVLSGNVGGRLEVVAREESTMTKAGAVATTETRVYERQPMSGSMALSSRSVGTLEERPDGSSVERVETYGLRAADGTTNVNATRPVLQQVVERQTTVAADGSVRERETVQGLSSVTPGRIAEISVTESVSKPTGSGEQVRTDVYERGVNGRLRPTRSTVEEIEK
jgi:hypothetical protein